jgi:hypothetical protein
MRAKLDAVKDVTIGFRPEDGSFEPGPALLRDAFPAESMNGLAFRSIE